MSFSCRASAVLTICIAPLAASRADTLPHAACEGWTKAATLTLTGTITAGGLTGVFSETIDSRDGRHVVKQDYDVFSESEGFDGNLSWAQDRSGASHFLDSNWAKAIARTEAWLSRRGWCDRRADTLAVTKMPDENRSGVALSVWQATPSGGIPALLRFTQPDNTLAETEVRVWGNRLIRRYDDWRDIGHGIRVPFAERDEDPEDEDTQTITIASAKSDPLPDSRAFAKPGRTHDYGIDGGRQSATVIYEDDGIGRIFVPVTIDGKGPFPFEVDTGGHLFLTQATADALQMTAVGALNATGGGTGIVKEGVVRTQEIRIGDAVLRNQPAKVVPLSGTSNDRGTRPPRAGLLGLELFERFAVTLDRHAKTMTVTPLEAFKAKPKGIALPIRFTEDAPTTPGTFDGFAGDFELDSGDAGPAIIEGYWADQRGLGTQLSHGIPWSGRGVGGEYRETLSRGNITLGTFNLPHEIVSYVGQPVRGSESTRMQAGLVGESSLYRFDMTYDYGHGLVWIDPQSDIPPRAFNRTGLRLKKDKTGIFEVVQVVPNSPAADAGIVPGDRILSIAGRPAAALAPSDTLVLFGGPIASVVAVSVAERENTPARTVKLTLREIVP